MKKETDINFAIESVLTLLKVRYDRAHSPPKHVEMLDPSKPRPLELRYMSESEIIKKLQKKKISPRFLDESAPYDAEKKKNLHRCEEAAIIKAIAELRAMRPKVIDSPVGRPLDLAITDSGLGMLEDIEHKRSASHLGKVLDRRNTSGKERGE